MCGIIGFIGKNVKENLIQGLEKLEYRGYDSSGMVILHNHNFFVEKAIGPVEKLKEKVKDIEFDGIGIAHTRWATHGKITIENCHPHFSSDNNIAIVHNGIIENFEELKLKLEKSGKYFYGQTDSEVIAKLLSKRLTINKIKRLISKIEGSYAIALISKNNNEIYFAKNKSPLYIAQGIDCSLIASDPCCFVSKCDKFYTIEDGEYGKISLNGLEVYNKNGEMIEKQAQQLNFFFKDTNKEKYSHYMIKEINESKNVLVNLIKRYQEKDIIKKLKGINIKKFNRIYLIGCGTAYHAGLVGEKYLKERFKIDVFTRKASEFFYQNDVLDEKSLCIFISQSGETADTISAMEETRKYKTLNVAIVNTEYSTLASKCDLVFPICAGQEKAVASTKAYFGQCLVLYIMASFLNGENFIEHLMSFKKDFDFGNDNKIMQLADLLINKNYVFFIGRGFDYITALEASLKLKEITYIFSYSECSGELKHGTLALINQGIPVIVIANDEKCFNKTLNNAYEVKSRGGELVLISSINIDNEIENNFEYYIKIKDCESDLKPLQTIVVLQKLAYYTAIKKGLNPDKPRNLAKSVTVE